MSNHKEAFCLMWYACDKCRHRERIWNSRDGVTPFGIGCTSCGDVMRHADWHLDEPAPRHQLLKGQRFFRNGTPDEAEAIMRRRIEQMKGTEYEADELQVARLIKYAREAKDGEFQPGWPKLDVHHHLTVVGTPKND